MATEMREDKIHLGTSREKYPHITLHQKLVILYATSL